MKNKYLFVLVLLAIILAAGLGITKLYVSQQNIEKNSGDLLVVTSFYPMYIAAENVLDGAEGVQLENLSEPQTGCLHDYQLTSADMKLLSTADVLIINGGGIETFMEEVAEQYPDLVVINACEDLTLMEDNAHAWMNLEDYQVQIETISREMGEADPSRAGLYEENGEAYEQKVEDLLTKYQDSLSGLAGKPVILFHEAYAYLADEFDMDIVDIMDLDEERQVSAGEVSDVLDEIQEFQVPMIFAEELYGKDMGDLIQKESDVDILYLDPLTRGDYDKDSYLNGMETNLQLIVESMD